MKIVSSNVFTKCKGNALTSEEFSNFISKNEIHDFYIAGTDARLHLLADKKGSMVVVECTPMHKKVRAAETFENGSIVCTVNSFTSDELKPYDDANGNQINIPIKSSI